MNNILIIGIITAAIIIAVAVLMLISQKSSQPSLAVMPNNATDQPSLAVCPPCNCSTTDQPSSQPKEQFIIYSDVNYTGESLELPGPGAYRLDPECGSGMVIPFKPKSVKMPDRYRIGIMGSYGNPGDTKCGPSIGWVTDPSHFNDLSKGLGSDWVYTNTGGYANGSVIIEDKSIVRYREDRYY